MATGFDSGSASASAAVAPGTAAPGAAETPWGGGAYPSDEEILGIGTDDGPAQGAGGAASPARPAGAADDDVILSEAKNPSGSFERDSSLRPDQSRDSTQNDNPSQHPPGTAGAAAGKAAQTTNVAPPPRRMAPLLSDPKTAPEAKALWETHQAYLQAFPNIEDARAVKELFPGGAADAKQLVARAREADALDSAYFSGDAKAQSQLAQYLLQDNPQAFQTMLSQGARALAERDPAAYAQFAEAVAGLANVALPVKPGFSPARPSANADGGLKPAPTPPDVILSEAIEDSGPAGKDLSGETQRGSSLRPDQARESAQNDLAREREALTRERGELTRERGEIDRQRGEFRAEQFAAFQASANDTVVSQVRQTIDQTIGNVLPVSVPEGARKRIAEDIFSDINTTLQSDRALAQQVAGLLQQWKFDAAARQQVVNLIFGRARALVPAVARRIVSEWTSSVLSASRQKSEKQNAAGRRVDITGIGRPDPVGAKRPLTPRDLDYNSTTDDQILSL